jgi:outer membrane protein assembly factor BamB
MRAGKLFAFAAWAAAVVAAGAAGVAEAAATDVIARVKPAVVMIECNLGGATAWGTGFFISQDGYLLTNNHVIQDAQRATVIYRNRDRLDAAVVTTDPVDDLALLKVTADHPFPTVALGDSDEVQEGAPVAVTGYPLPSDLVGGLGASLQSCTTMGAVSALRANAVPGVARSRPLLQYDAPTSHGNSGGPIYRADTGEVIGVVRLVLARGESLNLGIPVNQAKLLLQKAGVTLQPNVVAAESPEAQVAPGDISLLNTIGPDKALTSQLASSTHFGLAPQSYVDYVSQIQSNAGYFSCYGQFAPAVCAPTLVGNRLVLTGNDGRVRVHDPALLSLGEAPRPLFNVESRFMFFPAAAQGNEVYFSAGTPTFIMKEKTSTGLVILAILAGAPGAKVTVPTPTVDAEGGIYAINANNGNLDWQYDAGFVSSPVLAEGKVYFGGIGIYGALDAATGKELWVWKQKLGGKTTRWHTVAVGPAALYVIACPVRAETRGDYPGYAIVGDSGMRLMAVPLAGGKPRWEVPVTDLKGQENPLAVGLAVDAKNGRIYVTRNGQAWAFSTDGKQLWQYGEKPQAARAAQQKREKEKEFKSLLSRFSDAIAFDDDQVYLGGDDAKVYCLGAASGVERWTFTDVGAMEYPTLIGDTLFCSSAQGWTYALDPRTGALRWKVDIGARAVGRPLVYEGMLYASTQGAGPTSGQLLSVYLPQVATTH